MRDRPRPAVGHRRADRGVQREGGVRVPQPGTAPPEAAAMSGSVRARRPFWTPSFQPTQPATAATATSSTMRRTAKKAAATQPKTTKPTTATTATTARLPPKPAAPRGPGAPAAGDGRGLEHPANLARVAGQAVGAGRRSSLPPWWRDNRPMALSQPFRIRYGSSGRCCPSGRRARSARSSTIDGDRLRVQDGLALLGRRPAQLDRKAGPDTQFPGGIGAHGWRGKWLVNGAVQGLGAAGDRADAARPGHRACR